MRQQKKERKHSGGWQLWWHLSLHGRWQEQKIMATTLVIFYACRSVGWPKWPAKATENAACLGWFMLLNRGNNNIPENRYYSKEAGISISLLDEDLLLDLCTASFTSPMLLLLLSTVLAGWPSLIQVPLWFVRNFDVAKYLLPRDRYLIGFISGCWVRCSVALKLLLRSFQQQNLLEPSENHVLELWWLKTLTIFMTLMQAALMSLMTLVYLDHWDFRWSVEAKANLWLNCNSLSSTWYLCVRILGFIIFV